MPSFPTSLLVTVLTSIVTRTVRNQTFDQVFVALLDIELAINGVAFFKKLQQHETLGAHTSEATTVQILRKYNYI